MVRYILVLIAVWGFVSLNAYAVDCNGLTGAALQVCLQDQQSHNQQQLNNNNNNTGGSTGNTNTGGSTGGTGTVDAGGSGGTGENTGNNYDDDPQQNADELTNDGVEDYTNAPTTNINDGAKQGAASQGMGVGANMAAGGSLAAMCAMGCPGSCPGCCGCMCWACPLAAMAFTQAGHDMGAQNQSFDVADYTNFGEYDYDNLYDNLNPGVNPTDGTGIGGPGSGGINTGGTNPTNVSTTINTELDKLKDMGYTVDMAAGTVTTPNGTFPIENFNSPEAMAQAGYSEKDINMAKRKLAGINKKINDKYGDQASVVSADIQANRGAGNGGAGAAGAGAAGNAGAGDNEDFLGNFLKGLKKGKKKKMAGKGLKKNIDGKDAIGVKSDNIFEMVHRRYQTKRKRNIFIEPVTQGASVLSFLNKKSMSSKAKKPKHPKKKFKRRY